MSKLNRLLPLAIASSLAFALPTVLLPRDSAAQAVGVTITLAPPPIPVYAQPVIPGPGYLWTPGYWAWGPEGYYWVPGTWVLPPRVGLLWTPGYWGWINGSYLWHAGYWGPHVGFYGGINYGFGFFGVGFAGGHWDGDHFFYNRSVTNISNVHITNVYNEPVRNVTVNRVSFNGGEGGIAARPTPGEEAAARDPHVGATPLQAQHEHAASGNRAALASVNHGAPAVAATARPGSFNGPGVMRAHGAQGPAPQVHQASQPGGAPRPNANRGPNGQHQPMHNAGAPRPQGPQHQGPVHNAGGPRPAPHPQAHPQPQQQGGGGHEDRHP